MTHAEAFQTVAIDLIIWFRWPVMCLAWSTFGYYGALETHNDYRTINGTIAFWVAILITILNANWSP